MRASRDHRRRPRPDDDDRVAEIHDLQGLLFAIDGPSLPGRIGMPAFFIARLARALSPSKRITFGAGPMNLM